MRGQGGETVVLENLSFSPEQCRLQTTIKTLADRIISYTAHRSNPSTCPLQLSPRTSLAVKGKKVRRYQRREIESGERE